jgi:hypothetical protein
MVGPEEVVRVVVLLHAPKARTELADALVAAA